ncbi:MAG TPA: hypothetical protein VI731_04290 [Bacteroidia bacterium]|nr:hypothetical protein [Bacteroidia bacterium]
MKARLLISSAFAAVLLLFFAACNETSHDPDGEDTSTLDLNEMVRETEHVFIYVPSPLETATLLKLAGARFDKELLNSPENAATYSNTTSQALNLGVYGADLAFSGIFDQTAETMTYMKATGKLADALHISSAFSAERHKRIEDNKNNRDTILNIITDAYFDCNTMLNDNNQGHASALMIAGGWIEGFYLACRVAQQTNSKDIRVRIVEQRYSLDKLLLLLDKQKHESVQAVVADLKQLKKVFDAIPVKEKKSPAVSTDDQKRITVVGDDSDAPQESINTLDFNKIINKITEIRKRIVAAG